MKQRKDGRWCKQITINGKRVSFYSSAETERKAEKDIQQQLLEFQNKTSADCPFEAVAKRWKDHHCQKIPYTTWKKCYRSSYDVAVSFFGRDKVGDISTADCNRFIQIQISQMKSHKTISTLKSVTSMILDYAILEERIKYNPMKNIKLPANLPREPRKMPSDDEIKKVKQHYKGFDFLPYFLLYSGLRISEALALTDKEIDFERKTIHIRKKVVHDDNTPTIVYQTKTAAGMRDVILLDRLTEKMKPFKGLLFPNSKGELYTKKQLQSAWDDWKERLGVNVTAHQLRHAYATLLYESGVDVKTAQTLLGHADIKMTMDIYTDLRSKQIDAARAKLNDYDF